MEHAAPVQPIGSFSTRPSPVPVFKLRRGMPRAPVKSRRARSTTELGAEAKGRSRSDGNADV
jgi:hypothetical protein